MATLQNLLRDHLIGRIAVSEAAHLGSSPSLAAIFTSRAEARSNKRTACIRISAPPSIANELVVYEEVASSDFFSRSTRPRLRLSD